MKIVQAGDQDALRQASLLVGGTLADNVNEGILSVWWGSRADSSVSHLTLSGPRHLTFFRIRVSRTLNQYSRRARPQSETTTMG